VNRSNTLANKPGERGHDPAMSLKLRKVKKESGKKSALRIIETKGKDHSE